MDNASSGFEESTMRFRAVDLFYVEGTGTVVGWLACGRCLYLLQMIQLNQRSEFKYWFLGLIIDTVGNFPRTRTFVLESERSTRRSKGEQRMPSKA